MKATFDCDRTCPLHQERWCRFRKLTDRIGPVRVDSHVATLKVEFRDLDALALACERIGLKLRLGQKSYKWYGRWVNDYHGADAAYLNGMKAEDYGKCDHAISVVGKQGAYEIGLVQQPDGSYRPIYDFFSGGYGLMEAAGENLTRLITEYQVAVAEQSARQLGWLYTRDGENLVVYHPNGGQLTIKAGSTVEASGFVGSGCHEAANTIGLRYESMTLTGEAAKTAVKVQVHS